MLRQRIQKQLTSRIRASSQWVLWRKITSGKIVTKINLNLQISKIIMGRMPMASSSSSIALIRLFRETTRISLVLILSKDTQLKGTLAIKMIP